MESITLLSGGIASTYLAHKWKNSKISTQALHIISHPRSDAELRAASRLANTLDLELISVDTRSIVDAIGTLLVTKCAGGTLGIDPYESVAKACLEEGLPPPTGFYILIAIATLLARVIRAQDIYVGFTKDQFTRNPALSAFLDTWGERIQSVDRHPPLRIVSPLREMTRTEVLRNGTALGVDFSRAWTCTAATELHCGHCVGCKRRREAFITADTPDPATYALH
jgi:7-cyano-7-deazaguanine synthase